jgi:adenylosuccinate lyase
MIPRYTLPEMGALWTDEAKLATWVQVEVLACEAHAELGVVPPADLDAIRAGTPPTPRRCAEIEAETNHDVIAFLTAFVETIPDPDGSNPGRWVHYGMTSSDLLDTALGVTLARATDLVLGQADGLVAALKSRALEHWDTVCVGRTHGVQAEPSTSWRSSRSRWIAAAPGCGRPARPSPSGRSPEPSAPTATSTRPSRPMSAASSAWPSNLSRPRSSRVTATRSC